MVRIKRVYDKPERTDGYRILVDRLWPRGLKKENAAIDLWLKEVAPSDLLRKSFGHDPQRWPDFQRRYRQELMGSAALGQLKQEIGEHGDVTLVYAARDTERNNAVVLRDMLRRI